MSMDTITVGAGHLNDRMRTWIQGTYEYLAPLLTPTQKA